MRPLAGLQLVADLASALVVARELNPIAASILGARSWPWRSSWRLIALVVAVAEICDRRQPILARVVLLVGIAAGLLGALSNTHLTPFLAA